MWKRSDIEDDTKSPPMPRLSRTKEGNTEVANDANVGKTTTKTSTTAASAANSGQLAVIGPSIIIKGEMHGDENVLVEGRVEGTVILGAHQFIVGEGGEVAADVNAREVEVRGQLNGDIKSNDKVVIRSTGKVRGNVSSPRVVLEDGCQFKGAVDMDSSSDSKKPAGNSAPNKAKAG